MVGNNTPVFFIRDPSKFPGKDTSFLVAILLTDANYRILVTTKTDF
jgi:hypothetical protein